MPRRRFQQGCLPIVGNQWVLHFWRDELRDGIRVRVRASKRLGLLTLSKRQARKLAQPILNEINNPNAEIPVRDMTRGITLVEFIREWRKHAAQSLKPSTLRSMESSIRAHIIPLWGEVPITALDTKKFQELITSLEKRSRKTRENVYMDLQQILNAARRWHNGIPHVNKADLYFGAKKPGEGRAFFFTLKQVMAILKAFAGRKPWELFFLMLATTGLRASEILGLRVQDLDFEEDLIHVRQGAWHGQINYGEDSRIGKFRAYDHPR